MKIKLLSFLLAIIAGLGLNQTSFAADEEVTADVVVYGGTPAGIMAAIAAARHGQTVALVELNAHVGGMTSGGLTNTDIGQRSTVGGLAEEFLVRVVKYYSDTYGPESLQYLSCKNGRKYEPRIAELTFETMLKEQKGITVWKRHRFNSVTIDGGRVTSLIVDDLAKKEKRTFKGQVFVDASYTGDVMDGAGVPCRIGREARAEFGESLAGISKGPADVIGLGDHRTQAYNYRVNITGRMENRVLFPKPKYYNPEPFREKYGKRVIAGHIKTFADLLISKPGANDKYDANWNDLVGGNEGYAQGDWQTREEIEARHRDHFLSMLYYLQNDPELPKEFLASAQTWGLSKDEFTDNGNFPFQLYIRESRRMLGRYVLKQSDLTDNRVKADGVCAGNYGVDCHAVQYLWINGKRTVERTSHIEVAPYDIPYATMTPVEPGNLIVPVCLSSTHVAYCSLRMEPVFMMLGHAAGNAAHLALKEKTTVQDVNVQTLRGLLKAEGAVLDAAEKAAPVDYKVEDDSETDPEPEGAPKGKKPKMAKAEKAEKREKKKPANPIVAPIQDEPGLPRVLLIGDSVSMGYTLPVRELLEGKANVHRIPGNGSSSNHGLNRLAEWLGTGKWDVIHFNFGLHDAKQELTGESQVELPNYESNLREIVKQLKTTGAKLIWATTTPVPNGGELSDTRKFSSIEAYNAAALKIMQENQITIDDLNATILPQQAELQRPMDVHFNKEGSAFLGAQVAKSIAAGLAKH